MTSTLLPQFLKTAVIYGGAYTAAILAADGVAVLLGTGWAVLWIIATWIVVGAFYARSRSVPVERERAKQYSSGVDDGFDRFEHFMLYAWRSAFWPWAIVFDLGIPGLLRWFSGPVREREREAEELRERARLLMSTINDHSLTGEEARLTRELAKSLQEQAKAKDL